MSIPQNRMIFSNVHYVITNIWALCFAPYLNLQYGSQMFSISRGKGRVWSQMTFFLVSFQSSARPLMKFATPLSSPIPMFGPLLSRFPVNLQSCPHFQVVSNSLTPLPHFPIRSYASDILSWHRVNQFLILLLKAVCLALKQPISMNRLLFDPTGDRAYDLHHSR